MSGSDALGEDPGPWHVYTLLSTPIVITDARCRLVFLNARAQALWGVAETLGRLFWDVLPLLPPDGGDPGAWARDVLLAGLHSSARIPARTGGPGGARRVVVTGAWVTRQAARFAVLNILDQDDPVPWPSAQPAWALRDPLTGLHTPDFWEAQFAERDRQGGTVLLIEVEGLRAINALSGQDWGDQALVTAAAVISQQIPDGALAVRYGGQEFVVAFGPQVAAAEALAVGERIAAEAARAAAAAGLPLPLRLACGAATFGPGGLTQALGDAGDALYERKGILLRGAGPGRIIVTREGWWAAAGAENRAGTPVAPAGPPPPAPDPETLAYFGRTAVRTAEQAAWVVQVVAPEAGSAVVEVAAGNGRLAFDGGLARRVGRTGQLLLTDVAEDALASARTRARQLGFDWVRFLQAPVEDLPLAAGTADLVLGANFLHLTDRPTAIAAMARVVRPGGRVAVAASVNLTCGAGWHEALWPLREALAAQGLVPHDFLGTQESLEAAIAAAGLETDRVAVRPDEEIACPTLEVALALLSGLDLVGLWLHGALPERQAELEAAVQARVRRGFAGRPAADWLLAVDDAVVVAHRPQAPAGLPLWDVPRAESAGGSLAGGAEWALSDGG